MGWVKKEVDSTQRIFDEVAANLSGRIGYSTTPYEFFADYIRDNYDVTLKQCDEICKKLKAHFRIKKFYYNEF